MWFLGAGASAAAGMPTASQMIWEFKRLIYCTEQSVSIRTCADLSDPLLQARLQQYFDGEGGYPRRDASDEYAQYFERAHPREDDRRRYLEDRVRAAAPSYGHYALAALLAAGRVRIVWTTNMDRVLEDAHVQFAGTTTALTVASLDSGKIALRVLREERWPMLGKVHGDYQSSRLKNVAAELREQDAHIREALVESCRRFGLVVVGYSGRDDSVMDALDAAVADGKGYPQGLFWIHRSDAQPSPRVDNLIGVARATGIEAEFIQAETFDEVLDRVLLVEADLPPRVQQLLDEKRPYRFTPAPAHTGRRTYPVVRMNALPVLEWPNSARLVRCAIGGTKDVLAAVAAAGVDVLVGRRRDGVVGFGADADMERAFRPTGALTLDLYPIEPRRLRIGDSVEHGLLYDALLRGITRVRPLFVRGRREEHLLVVDTARQADPALQPLRSAVGAITGTIGAAGGIRWMEALEVRLEFRDDRLWLVLEPVVWADRPEPDHRVARADFIRERTATRYNREANVLLDAWIAVLLGGSAECIISAYGGLTAGVDAVFRVGGTTAFSWRGEAA